MAETRDAVPNTRSIVEVELELDMLQTSEYMFKMIHQFNKKTKIKSLLSTSKDYF